MIDDNEDESSKFKANSCRNQCLPQATTSTYMSTFNIPSSSTFGEKNSIVDIQMKDRIDKERVLHKHINKANKNRVSNVDRRVKSMNQKDRKRKFRNKDEIMDSPKFKRPRATIPWNCNIANGKHFTPKYCNFNTSCNRRLHASTVTNIHHNLNTSENNNCYSESGNGIIRNLKHVNTDFSSNTKFHNVTHNHDNDTDSTETENTDSDNIDSDTS